MMGFIQRTLPFLFLTPYFLPYGQLIINQSSSNFVLVHFVMHTRMSIIASQGLVSIKALIEWLNSIDGFDSMVLVHTSLGPNACITTASR